MDVEEIKRLKALEDENARLKRLAADLTGLSSNESQSSDVLQDILGERS
jgi:hypothetical protein